MKKILKHLMVVIKHKMYVFIACKKSGIIWRGVKHDISKLSLVEFIASAKHFQGDKSPIDAEKEELGYSAAWAHHKGRNSHHWQYWTDWDTDGNFYCMRMPLDDVKEMMCDWIGAGKAYSKDAWTCSEPQEWFNKNQWYRLHFETRILIEKSLLILSVYGEDRFFHYLKSEDSFCYGDE